MDGPRLRHRFPANQRLHAGAYQEVGRPCHFTIRCAAGASPFAVPHFASIAVNCLLAQQAKSNCAVLAYCVMPDHVHVLVAPAAEGASTITYVGRFKGWASRELRLAGWRGEVWQPRSYDHLLRDDESTAHVAAYIVANPVRRGLCREPEEYPWSAIIAQDTGTSPQSHSPL